MQWCAPRTRRPLTSRSLAPAVFLHQQHYQDFQQTVLIEIIAEGASPDADRIVAAVARVVANESDAPLAFLRYSRARMLHETVTRSVSSSSESTFHTDPFYSVEPRN